MMSNELFTTDEAAGYLRTTNSHIHYLRTSGRLPHIRVGKFVRFTKADIDAYIEAQRGVGYNQADHKQAAL